MAKKKKRRKKKLKKFFKKHKWLKKLIKFLIATIGGSVIGQITEKLFQ